MISDEAVEAAANASYDAGAFCGECYYEGWGECSVCQRLNMGYARAALEAAAPHIESALLEAGWQEPEKPYIDDRSTTPFVQTYLDNSGVGGDNTFA